MSAANFTRARRRGIKQPFAVWTDPETGVELVGHGITVCGILMGDGAFIYATLDKTIDEAKCRPVKAFPCSPPVSLVQWNRAPYGLSEVRVRISACCLA
jgi:hypothetical protein